MNCLNFLPVWLHLLNEVWFVIGVASVGRNFIIYVHGDIFHLQSRFLIRN